jgi:hypothetical protein
MQGEACRGFWSGDLQTMRIRDVDEEDGILSLFWGMQSLDLRVYFVSLMSSNSSTAQSWSTWSLGEKVGACKQFRICSTY